eukprot:6206369-Amphidinium_carterae.1
MPFASHVEQRLVTKIEPVSKTIRLKSAEYDEKKLDKQVDRHACFDNPTKRSTHIQPGKQGPPKRLFLLRLTTLWLTTDRAKTGEDEVEENEDLADQCGMETDQVDDFSMFFDLGCVFIAKKNKYTNDRNTLSPHQYNLQNRSRNPKDAPNAGNVQMLQGQEIFKMWKRLNGILSKKGRGTQIAPTIQHIEHFPWWPAPVVELSCESASTP